MKYVKGIFAVCILICILLTVFSVSAADIGGNETLDVENDQTTVENSVNDTQLTFNDDEDVLAASTVYFDASASSDGDGSSAHPYKTFKWNRVGSGTTAYFADGTYTLDSTKSISSSFKSLTFIGHSSQNTIFKSGFDETREILIFENVDFTIKNMALDGFHIENYGNIIADNVVFANEVRQSYGAVILNLGDSQTAATLKLTNCRFESNAADAYGGAIYAKYSDVTITNCVFYNSTSGGYGGAIYTIYSNMTVSNSQFNRNVAGYGGSIYSERSRITLKQSLYSSGSADFYGGILGTDTCSVEIRSCNFTDSESLNDAGGALYLINGTDKIYSSRFINLKSSFGGAICILSTESEIQDCTFTNNFATFYGGSIYDGWGKTKISQSNFKNTRAGRSGGSIYSSLTLSLNLAGNDFRNSTAPVGYAVSIDPVINNVFTASQNRYEGTVFDLKNSNPICFYNTNPYYEFDTDYSVPVISYTPDYVTSLPSSYDSRDYGYVTPVVNQGGGGNCWAFACIATLEACLKKATGITYDFSEENVKNLMAYYSLYGRNMDVNDGGNLLMAMGYMMGWYGPIYDYLDVYTEFSALSANYNSLLHIQNVYEIPGSDIESIKRAIIDYGAVVAAMPWISRGHAISLVGWDDNYNSLDFFNNYAQGAWIFKNSYGEKWKDHGYFYVSFDRTIYNAYTFIFNDDKGYTDIYQYDLAGPTTLYFPGVYDYRTKFISRSSDILSAVSTYFKEETDYTVTIYKNGVQVATQSGHSLSGYRTIPLQNEIQLKNGDEFVVEFSIVEGSIPLSFYGEFNASQHINTPTFGKGDSFMKVNGEWVDLYDYSSSGQFTACIKAYTRPATLDSVAITIQNQFSQIEVNEMIGIEINADASISGIVTITIDNEKHYARLDNGYACLNISFDKKAHHVLNAQYVSNREASNVVSFAFDVVEEIVIPKVTITAADVSKYYGGSQNYVATVYDNGVRQKGVDVEIIIDGKARTARTDSNGQVSLSLSDLGIGSYIVTARYNSVSHSSKFTIKSTLSAGDANGTYMNTTMNATLLDSNGNPLKNGQAIFMVGGKEFRANVKNGIAVADIDCGAGEYEVTVRNPSTGEETEVHLVIERATQEYEISIKQDGDKVTVSVHVIKGVQNGRCYLYVYHAISESVNMVNGFANFTVTGLEVGDNWYILQIYGDENYKLRASGVYDYITFMDENVSLSANDMITYFSSGDQFTATLTHNGEPFDYQYLTFEINGKIHNAYTDSLFNTVTYKGKAYIPIDEDLGTYDVRVSYGNITLIKKVTVKSTINLTAEGYDRASSTMSAAFLNSKGQPIRNWDVEFLVNGKSYYATTDNSGIASAKVKLNVGVNTITVINPVTKEEKSINMTWNKATPTISLSNPVLGKSVTLMAALNPNTASGNVTFMVSGSVYTVAVKNGQARLNLVNLNPGTYGVSAVYSGDDYFWGVSASTTFTIASTETKVVAGNINMFYLDSKDYSARLIDSSGKPLASKDLRIVICNSKGASIQVINKKTDANGYVKFAFSKKPGTYYVNVYYEGKLKATSKVVVKKAKSYFVASKKTFKARTKIKKYKVSLELKEYYLTYLKVTLKVKGKTYKATTNSKGKATFKITKLKKKGTYTAVIKYKGNAYYAKATKKVKIRVK